MVVEQELYRVRGYLNLIALLLLYGSLIVIGLLVAITLKLFHG